MTRAFRDSSKTWVDVVDEVRWIDNGQAFLWVSERDGWQHVFRVARGGGEGTLVTRFDADVIDVVGTDEANGWLYFLASPASAAERYLYRSKLDGSGAPERVTPAHMIALIGTALASVGAVVGRAFPKWPFPVSP